MTYELRNGEICGVDDETEVMERCGHIHIYTFRYREENHLPNTLDMVKVSTYCSEQLPNYFDLQEILDFESHHPGYILTGWKRKEI
jgi:hypothetical protein